ncbi:MAG: ABC transporter ATP-binding protein [Bifidobacteriaceae bacterium]|jgi:oligopeptide/dipeptide ABC transporter ATP-binding protein|nr:ABC transporter ATP-binding protein [Bifidobacteriaceae bacterium]
MSEVTASDTVRPDEDRRVLTVSGLSVEFAIKGAHGRKARLRAVDDVSFDLRAAEVIGLVGESGSGKTTTGRALMRLVEPKAGRVILAGRDITNLSQRQLRRYRRHVQMVFQDPMASLDPSMVIGDSVAEPLIVHERLSRQARDAKVGELLYQVGLSPALSGRYPYELSGGQRQRVSIARAIAVRPDVLVCDEALSALDVSAQNGIIRLLDELRENLSTALVFISHDLSVVRNLADTVAVMYLGQVVESGPTERVYHEPAHPYTRALLSAVPVPNPEIQKTRQRIRLLGEPPDPANPPPGCAFGPRCANAIDICHTSPPPQVAAACGVTVRCHLTQGTARPADPRLSQMSREKL